MVRKLKVIMGQQTLIDHSQCHKINYCAIQHCMAVIKNTTEAHSSGKAK